MTRRVSLVFVLPLLLPLCTGCNATPIEEKGEKIPEDTSETHIIEDNYRNYYEIYVQSFYDSNNDKKGDLNGVTAKLDYIKSTGYNGIWLMPIFSSHSYHKYDCDNYYEIDKDYGTMDDLQNLINKAHEKNIRVILDLVINHSSRYNEYFIKAQDAYAKRKAGNTLTDEETEYANMYVFSDTKPNSAWNVVENKTYNNYFYVYSRFDYNMPEFNFESSFAKGKMRDIANYYLNLGVDGFRLDAVKHYYEGENFLTKTINFLNDFDAMNKMINSDCYLVGEVLDTSASAISAYYDSNIDSYFDFTCSQTTGYVISSTNLNGDLASKYLDGAKQTIKMAKGHIPAPLLDNHDLVRYSRKDETITKYFYGLLAMLNGSVFTYYGSEIAMNAVASIDQNYRTYMFWADGEFTGKCDNPLGTTSCNYDHDPYDVQVADENSIYNYHKKANYLRNKFPLIARGNILESSYLDETTSLVVIDKKYKDQTLTFAFNFKSDRYTQFKIGENRKVVGQLVADNETYIGQINKETITIPPYGIAIIE